MGISELTQLVFAETRRSLRNEGAARELGFVHGSRRALLTAGAFHFQPAHLAGQTLAFSLQVLNCRAPAIGRCPQRAQHILERSAYCLMMAHRVSAGYRLDTAHSGCDTAF